MKKLLSYITLALLTVSVSFAQNETDALRFSQFNYGGTARFMSMGGAFGALGGDFSSLAINPAGIGIYRRSEFSFTPMVTYNQIGSTYFNSFQDDMKYGFNFSNLGFVLAMNNSGGEGIGWKGFQLGFGYNRIANFDSRFIAQGFNTQSSLMTHYLAQANAEGDPSNFDPFSTALAWDAYLIDIIGGEYFVDMAGGNVLQRKEVNTSGSIREMSIVVGGNFNDMLYLGSSFNFPRVNYQEESFYTEVDSEGINDVFNNFELNKNLSTKGSGFNFKLGAIARPHDMIRLGVSFHSPTFYELNDRFDTRLKSSISFLDTTVRSPKGRFDYELSTPARLNGSLAIVLAKYGLVSLDYEMVDYTKMRLRSGNYQFSNENNIIRQVYDVQHNIRAGAELRLDPLVLRGGYAIYGSPYKSGANDGAKTALSGGLGIREKHYSLDFGYVYSKSKEDYYLYSAEYTPPVKNEFEGHAFMVTLGLRF